MNTSMVFVWAQAQAHINGTHVLLPIVPFCALLHDIDIIQGHKSQNNFRIEIDS